MAKKNISIPAPDGNRAHESDTLENICKKYGLKLVETHKTGYCVIVSNKPIKTDNKKRH